MTTQPDATDPVEELLDHLRQTLTTTMAACPTCTAKQARAQDAPKLTVRQLEILELLADGLTAHQIARRLYLGDSTVKGHLCEIARKFGGGKKTAIVRDAMRYGIIQ